MNSTAREDSMHNSQVIESQAPSLDQLRIELALTVLATPLTVCKLVEEPTALPAGELCCFTRTSDEISLVCETAHTPSATTAREDGWRALRVEGPLDFGLIGILAKIANALAQVGVSIFAVSTYDTDYVLVKEDKLVAAVDVLQHAGCTVNQQ